MTGLTGPSKARGKQMPGFRINHRRRKVQPDLVERFRTLPAAVISDVMAR
jgi:hypothetical protein